MCEWKRKSFYWLDSFASTNKFLLKIIATILKCSKKFVIPNLFCCCCCFICALLFYFLSIRFDSFESLALSFIRSQNIVCHLDMCDSVRDSNGVNRIIAINVDFVVYAYGFCGILDILLLPCAVVFVFTFYFRSFCYVMWKKKIILNRFHEKFHRKITENCWCFDFLISFLCFTKIFDFKSVLQMFKPMKNYEGITLFSLLLFQIEWNCLYRNLF